MSRVIKMGVAASKICLKDADISVPDAIITGTGFGCLEGTEDFLVSMIENDEKFLSPASFIQSTHNTISAQIALELKSHSYNYAYVHRGFSFESALIDGMMLINEKEAGNVLVGGIDELIENYFRITGRMGLWKKGKVNNLELYSSKTKGTIAGEGASFFVLGDETSGKKYAKLVSVTTFFRPGGMKEISDKIENFLQSAPAGKSHIDAVLFGINGDSRYDNIYYDLVDQIFPEQTVLYYKHLCGEYFTSTAFALWMAVKILNENKIPAYTVVRDKNISRIKNILIYNHFQNIDHSLILVSGC
jgi:3-oxoacyl-(acyl-carrier-protein) synthase